MPAAYPVPTQMLQQLWDRFVTAILSPSTAVASPIQIRPGMVIATAVWCTLLAIIGLAPLPELPVNDKALHFFGMGFATFLIYFILVVPETSGRLLWYVRHAPLLVTLVWAFFINGVVSEIIQSLLPWKSFQKTDILANLLGSSFFLYLAHLANQRLLRQQEISSLYQPLSAARAGRYRDAQGREHAFDAPSSATPVGNQAWGGRREGNVWDEESDSGRSRDSEETQRGAGYASTAPPTYYTGDNTDAVTPSASHQPGGIQL